MAAHPKKRKTNDVLCIKMFGSFSISQIPAKAMRDITTASGNAPSAEIALARIDTFTSAEPMAEITASLSGRAHRLWLLVAYLIVNRDHGVSPQELIDLLWPEVTSNNPASTLQNNVSRARALFSEANFDDARDLIKHTDGLYYWAPERSTLLDIEIFETNARRIGDFLSADDAEGIELALETCKLYTGDFLSDATDITWCANLAVYYRTLYKRLCKTTIIALMEAGRLKEAQTLCLQVCVFDPAAEEFSLLLMQAYLADANPTAALEQYQTIANYLSQTYDIQPSAELETQREIALQELYGQSMNEQGIRTFLFESNDDEGAFACSNAVFREIALLRLREMERSGEDSHIIAISFSNPSTKTARRIINAKRVAQVLSATLRASDPFTKVGSNQFLVLLPGASAENALMVYERIVARFKDNFPRAELAFRFSMMSLAALR
jgi:DNA-binding SARP family transcriptional activator